MIHIGAVSLNTEQSAPESRTRDGVSVPIAGWLAGATTVEAELVSDALAGYVESGELVPVAWDEHPSFDGRYRCEATSREPTQGDDFLWTWTVDLVREVRDGAGYLESRQRGGMRPEAYDLYNLAASQMWEVWAVPSAAEAVDLGIATIAGTWTRTGPGGSADMYRSAPDQIYRGSARYVLGVRDSYSMAARLLSSNVPVTAEDAPLPVDDWCLSNGLVRIVPTSTGIPQIAGPDGVNASTWAAPYTMTMWYFDSIVIPLGHPVAAQSVRTAPQESSVRLTFAPAGVPTHVYLSLLRGGLGVTVSWGTRKSGGVRWGVGDGTDLNVVSHSFGGDPVDIGVETDDLDATGNRVCIIPTTEWGIVAGPSGDVIMTDDASQRALWHIGWLPDSAGSNDNTVAQMKSFFFAADERVQVLR